MSTPKIRCGSRLGICRNINTGMLHLYCKKKRGKWNRFVVIWVHSISPWVIKYNLHDFSQDFTVVKRPTQFWESTVGVLKKKAVKILAHVESWG